MPGNGDHCEHGIVSLPVNDAIDAVMQIDAMIDASTSPIR